MSSALMSEYEQRAWDTAIGKLNQRDESRARKSLRRATEPVKVRATQAWGQLPGHGALEDQVRRALEGLTALTLEPAMNSVNLDRVARRVGVQAPSEFRDLDLRQLDSAFPRTRRLYALGAFAEGSASAVAVTGAEVASTVTAGTTLAVAAGAIAADAAASIALMGRIVGLVAAQYGYDVREPDEEMFALGVISVGTAGTPAAKLAALSSLSRLTQQMMRRATWAELHKHGLVKAVDVVFRALGFRLTQRKLGQAVPVLGIALNGGMSAQLADSTYRNARDVYRVRFLSDKYGIDPQTWVTEPSPRDESPDDIMGPALDVLVDGEADEGPSS